MMNSRRLRSAADVALGYAADARGNGVAYAAIATGRGTGIVRLPFAGPPLSGLDGLDQGYAAVSALGRHLKARGVGRARVRVADARLVQELNGSGSPPKALAMAYVRVRCLLNGLGAVRFEVAEPVEIRDLVRRACTDVGLHVAA